MKIISYFFGTIKDTIVTISMVMCMVCYISFMIVGFSLDNEIWVLVSTSVITIMAILSRFLGDHGKLMTIGVTFFFLVLTYGVLFGYYGCRPWESFFAEFMVCVVGNLILYGLFHLSLMERKTTVGATILHRFMNFINNFINQKIVNYFIRLLAHGGLTACLVLMVTSENRADLASKNELVFHISNYVVAFLQSSIFATLSTWRKNG